jgi:hypothetical protein
MALSLVVESEEYNSVLAREEGGDSSHDSDLLEIAVQRTGVSEGKSEKKRTSRATAQGRKGHWRGQPEPSGRAVGWDSETR